MNEVNEVPKELFEVPSLPDVKEMSSRLSVLQDYWTGIVDAMDEYWQSVSDTENLRPEVVEAREYGVNECADVAKDCFSPEVIREWGSMDLNTRNDVLQEYADGIGDALEINFKGIIWEEFPIEDGSYTFGYNAGDGYVHLNVDLLADPAQLMRTIDTIAHEARHQLQVEAIENPTKFPIDEATIKEWTIAHENYTLEMPSAYDPWGYTYNPMETDARYFGESMVRELTKGIINNA